jgi:Sec-independent protein secretion pathway component TatC
MDSEIKDLLERNLAVNTENNRILRGLRRANRLAFVWRIIYLAIFLGGAALAFQYLKPYYENAMSTYNSAIETQTKISEGFNKFLPR